MSQEVLYRKWRPQRFGDVAGQLPITTTLRNAVAAGTPAHAYLFTGPRGTGKTSTGRILAKAVNCPTPVAGEPCDACPSCEAFNTGRAFDLIELDAASNRGIDEVRALREAAGYSPNNARYKVYLIDEVHMLTDAAFNALLKTLEEPPPHVIFVLATTEAHRIPATITSRCQRFDFRRIVLSAVVDRLRTVAEGEGLDVAPGGFEAIARQATGSLRDAVNLLDQLVAYHGRTLDLDAIQRGLGLVVDHRTTELARAAVTRDLAAGLTVLAAARDDGIEVRAFVREVVGTLRMLLMMKAGATEALTLSDSQAAELRMLAVEAQATDIVAALRALGAVDFAGDPYDSLPAEVAFASLAVGLTDAPVASVAAMPSLSQGATAPRLAAPSAARPVPPRRGPPPQPGQPRPPQPRAMGGEPEGASRPAPVASAQAALNAADRPVRTGRGASVAPDEVDAPADLLAVRAQWPDIRERARKRYFKAGPLLQQAHIKRLGPDSIEVGFQFPALLSKVQDDGKVMQAIHDAVEETLGRSLDVVPVVWEALQQSSSQQVGAASAPAPATVGGGHLVDEALQAGATRVEG